MQNILSPILFMVQQYGPKHWKWLVAVVVVAASNVRAMGLLEFLYDILLHYILSAHFRVLFELMWTCVNCVSWLDEMLSLQLIFFLLLSSGGKTMVWLWTHQLHICQETVWAKLQRHNLCTSAWFRWEWTDVLDWNKCQVGETFRLASGLEVTLLKNPHWVLR